MRRKYPDRTAFISIRFILMKRKTPCCAEASPTAKLPCQLCGSGKDDRRTQPEHMYVVTSSETVGQHHGNTLPAVSWSSHFPCANCLAQRNGQSARIQPKECRQTDRQTDANGCYFFHHIYRQAIIKQPDQYKYIKINHSKQNI